ncbi:L-lysine 6-transaminase [bacterium]|nr:L-lysine 6-transaminase [bacterium]
MNTNSIKNEKTVISPKDVHQILGKSIITDGYPCVLDLQKSKGMYIYDSREEKWYLDFFSCIASLPLGYNHPKLITKEFLDKIAYVSVNKPSNSDIYTVEMAEFVDTFRRLAVPPEFKHLFFISGGALAVENALKVAFDWKVKKNFAKGATKELGTQVIHFEKSFHGRSGYTMSLTNTIDPRKTDYFPKFNWPRIINPKITFPLNEGNLRKVQELEEKALSQINQAFKDNPDDIAAIILEPIQAEGGDHHFRNEFFSELRKIADANEAILIFDEVQTGMGITGTMWAYQQLGVVPDIVVFGKKTQVCGIMVTDRVDEVKDNCFTVSSRLNSTWGGNLTDMVRFQKILEIIDEENLVESARVVGEYLLEKVKELQDEFPDKVTNARGRGLMVSFDLPSPEYRKKLLDELFKNDLMVLPCGVSSIRFRPPLIVQKEDVQKGIILISEALANTEL